MSKTASRPYRAGQDPANAPDSAGISKMKISNPNQEEENHDDRRARLKAKKKMQEEEEEMPFEMEDDEIGRDPVIKVLNPDEMEDEEESDAGEDGSDSESEEESFAPVRHAPIFKRRDERETTLMDAINDDEQYEKEEAEREKRAQERKAEAKHLLDQITAQAAAEAAANDQEEETEDDGDGDEAYEYDLWKLRELGRIKREKEAKALEEAELAEVEKRRELSDMEVTKLDADLLKPKEKEHMKFLQKYYHKGAFFRSFDEKDEIGNRNFNLPTLEDHVDKEALPKILQRKNFGKAGNTKYTHLKDQDTTDWDAGWIQKGYLQRKNSTRLGGVGAVEQQKRQRR
eukprot:TRINITY_DN1332_c0_g4_i1.p1 TRINITY_DN1332_c0_g4~~TRINITY_DN1332_c0_g4_i1.p1  ORF type:complete len:344 (+),score=124.73 TRINITY_DN1332_c0_g4_i1:39-1070(+)